MSDRVFVVRVLLIALPAVLLSGCIIFRDTEGNRVDFGGRKMTVTSPEGKVFYEYDKKTKEAVIYHEDGEREVVIER